MFFDYDFHPDEETVRVFSVEPTGVLRIDSELLVYQIRYPDDEVLRHYAFGDRWYKINVTTDLDGELTETGDPGRLFAFNCDIATPSAIDGGSAYSVDLFADVLVRADGTTHQVSGLDELDAMCEWERVSRRERQAALTGLAQLLQIVNSGSLFEWLDSIELFLPCEPPPARNMTRRLTPSRLRPKMRPTWT